MNEEIIRLENVAKDKWYEKGVNFFTIKYSGEIFKRFLIPGSILELGPAEGVMTKEMISITDKYTVVEGSKIYCDDLKVKFPNINIVNSLFEDYNPHEKFNNIILGHVLEHVSNPVEILVKAKSWLAPNGVILSAVPNAFSIHRQAAVVMGILNDIYELNETDIHHGHRRVYDAKSFQNDFKCAGLNILSFGGYWLKPLSNRQLEQSWSSEMILAFMELGEKYPDIAAEIYLIANLQ